MIGHTVGAVDHDDVTLALGVEELTGGLDALRVVVGAAGTATEDDIAIFVAFGGGYGNNTLLGRAHKVVTAAHGLEGVHGSVDRAVGSVLEADGERQSRSKLTVELGLGGAGTDGTDTDQISSVLGRDCVKHLAGDGDAKMGDVRQELASNLHTLVDVVAIVNIGVVDDSLPAHSGTGLLQVGAHDDAEIIPELGSQLAQASGVFESGFRIVNAAGAN